MTASVLLARLEGVRERRPGEWSARCPAHRDKSPSLSIRETDDGKVLVHCFAGCSAAEVIAAVGLEMSDLFPQRPELVHFGKPARRRPVDGWHVLEVLTHRLNVVRLAVAEVARGERLAEPDLVSVRDALNYIDWIIEEARS